MGVCVCVRNLHDIQHAPNTQLAEIHLIVQNVCRICLVAPEFLSVCVNQIQLALSVDCLDRCLSGICNGCTCRVQASVRLLKMLRRIVCKSEELF